MSDGGTTKKAGQIFLWVVTVALGALMLLAGTSKFMQPEMWVTNFEGWGYPGVFAYVVGTLEVAGALAFFVPRLATYAGVLIAVIMCGAAATLIMNPGPLGATDHSADQRDRLRGGRVCSPRPAVDAVARVES